MTTIVNKNLMKAVFFSALAMVGVFSSCKKKDDTTTTTATGGTVTVQGEITTDQHWTADQKILLKGYVYVTSGHTLTIDAGTIIKGDKTTKGTLIIEQGAKINAVGTSSSPIIFTSNQPAGSRTYGDWGGVILCGYAPNNWIAAPKTDGTTGNLTLGIGQVEGGPRSLYGGNNPGDNSGTLSYVRIEFGGVAFSPNNEINGLTLCSVGSATQVDHIQVSYSGDDSYEWFGGNVNCKYLIAHKGWDDDFDTDNGYSGMVQFGMIYRDPYSADQSGSHSFESDSRNENATATLLTAPVFSNVTTVGPLTNPNFNGYNANFVCGEVVRRASSLSLFNSMIVGFPLGVIVDEESVSYGSTYANITAGTLKFKNNAIVGTPARGAQIVGRVKDPHSTPNSVAYAPGTLIGTYQANDSSAWTGSPSGPFQWLASNNNYYGAIEGTSSRMVNAFNGTNPNFIPSSTSYVVYNITTPSSTTPTWPSDFTDSKLSGATAVGYIGAFSANDTWTQGWTNFDPVSADYGLAY